MRITDSGWCYYNHSLLPDQGPHEAVDVSQLSDQDIWKEKPGYPFFATWVTDFDTNTETDWWYCIKDTPFEMDALKAKRRYEIRKGKKNFRIKQIDPEYYREALYQVQEQAYSAWEVHRRPYITQEDFAHTIEKWKDYRVYGAFDWVTEALCGFACVREREEYADFQILRTIPARERDGINAALIAQICEDFSDRLGNGYYISDGSRSMLHETAFQDYLEKYFGFRKAYCRLHMRFRRPFGLLVKFLYPFRAVFAHLKGSRLAGLVYATLQMWGISEERWQSFYVRRGKRILDVLFSLLLLIAISPVLLLTALAVRMNLGSPVIFEQPRPGKDGRIFTIYKFRSMRDTRDPAGNLLPDNERLTTFGKVLRASSLDELPQLVNILKGDMSFVGPRPQLVRDMVFMTPEQKKRHVVLPGLTGMAQVNGRYDIAWEEKLAWDLEYEKKISFGTDLKILLQTIRVVLKRPDKPEAKKEYSEDFGDYLLHTGQITKEEYEQKQQEAEALLREV